MVEIFHLVEHGFSSEHLETMPLSRRRFFFKMYLNYLKAKNEAQEAAMNGRSHSVDASDINRMNIHKKFNEKNNT